MAKPSNHVNTKKTLFQLRCTVRMLYLFCKTWDLVPLMGKLFSNADNITQAFLPYNWNTAFKRVPIQMTKNTELCK